MMTILVFDIFLWTEKSTKIILDCWSFFQLSNITSNSTCMTKEKSFIKKTFEKKPTYLKKILKILTEMGRERINHIRKGLRRNPLRCISNPMPRKSATVNLKKKCPYLYQYQMGRESLVGKLSRGIILKLKHYWTRLLRRDQISFNRTLHRY